jgi:thiol:disulfide interchange protein DsbD
MSHKLFTLFLAIVSSLMLQAQADTALSLHPRVQVVEGKKQLIITARPKNGGKLLSVKTNQADGLVSSFLIDSTAQQSLVGGWQELGSAKQEIDTAIGQEAITFYQDSVQFIQSIQENARGFLEGRFSYLIRQGDTYLSGEIPWEVNLDEVTPNDGTSDPNHGAKEPSADAPKGSLWSFFLGGLLAGFGAFIMPCIYAMVPVTVSFFTKRSKTRKQGIKNALVYAGSIMGIFTAIGFLITLIFGPAALNNMASSAWFNVFVFLMFVVFGISFLGAFEITLPSSLTNKVDTKAGLGSYSGIFFMALTLVIVSFSCTVPFIGLLTVWTAKGGMMAPLVGFLGFSFALSLPFALFAFFPALLNNLAKSGGWLNTIKVVLGFIELALALKFLSSADLAYHWGILDREVYLSLWIVIFGLLGLYLLGKLKFHHDDDLPKNEYGHPYLTVTRLFFAIAAWTFTIYLVPGLWGAPLKGISAWLPEMKTQDFNLNKQLPSTGTTTAYPGSSTSSIAPKKYADFLESEIPGVVAYFDYEEGMAAAKALKKPVLIDFTGHSCANCRKMEQEVLTDPAVTARLQQDFVVISLYVDDKHKLAESERYVSKHDGETVKTVGDKNLDFEITLTGNPAQPQYVFVDNEGKIMENAGGYDPNIARFISILDRVKKQYAEKR